MRSRWTSLRRLFYIAAPTILCALSLLSLRLPNEPEAEFLVSIPAAPSLGEFSAGRTTKTVHDVNSLVPDIEERVCKFPLLRHDEWFSSEHISYLHRRFLAYSEDLSLRLVDRNGGNRSPSYPMLTGDGFRALAAYICDDVKQCGMVSKARSFLSPEGAAGRLRSRLPHQTVVVFVKGDMLSLARERFLDKMTDPFILVTQNSAVEAPGNHRDLLHHKYLRAWIAKNANFTDLGMHSKLVALPIGIESRTGKIGKDPEQYFRYMQESADASPELWIFSSFKIATWPEERTAVSNLMRNISHATTRNKFLSQKGFFREILNHRFIAAPRGMGMDSHRLFETIILGRVPIVKRSPLTDYLYQDLPVLIVDEWREDELSVERLRSEYSRIRSGRYNFHKLFFDYWAAFILYVSKTPDWQMHPGFC